MIHAHTHTHTHVFIYEPVLLMTAMGEVGVAQKKSSRCLGTKELTIWL